MLVTDKKLERELGYIKNQLTVLQNRYWELVHKHDRLLNHLGIREEIISPGVVLKPIKRETPE